MKIGKTRNKSGILKVLLGLAVAGVLLFAGCQNIFDMAEIKSQDDGYGYVIVDLGDSVRTTRPGFDQLRVFEYIFEGVDVNLGTSGANANKLVYRSDSATTTFSLPVGFYTLEVNAYAVALNAGISGVAKSAVGKYNGTPDGVFQVVSGTSAYRLDIVLTAQQNLDENATDAGTLKLDIIVPSNATAIYELKQLSANGTLLWEYDGFSNPIEGNNFPRASFNNQKFQSGTYLFTGRITTTDATYGGFSEAIHVVDKMATVFEKNYTVAGSLTEINNELEAIALLKADLKSWIGSPNPLTTVQGKDQEDSSDGKKTTFNYVAAKLETPGEFPLGLLGGWKVEADDDNDGTANAGNTIWYVGDSSGPTKFRLINPKVKANADKANDPATGRPGSVPNIAGDVEYFVEPSTHWTLALQSKQTPLTKIPSSLQ